MTPFSISGILIGLSSFGFGIFVYWKSPHRRIGKLWLLFSISTGTWGAGIAWIGSIQNPEVGLLAWQLTYALGVLWISPIFYHFTCAFLGLDRKRSIAIHYFLAAAFLCFIPSKVFFIRCELVFEQFCYIRGGQFYHLFMLWWMGLVIFSHFELLRSMKTASRDRKNQIQYFFLATAIGYTGGFHTYFPKIGIDIYPWGSFAFVIYPIIMTYAMMKFNLLDIRIFIRRAVALFGIYLTLILGSAPLLLILHKKVLSSSVVPLGLLTTEIVLISGVLSLGPFIYAAFVRRSYWLRGNVASGLTHELKSPLSAIQSAAAILEAKIKSPQDIKTNPLEYISMIQTNADRLESFVKDLLNVARIQGDEIALNKSVCDLVQLTESAIADMKPLTDQKGLKVMLQHHELLPIKADPKKLHQVVSNLLSNAIKFSERGEIDIQIARRNGEVTFSIKDEGCGIPDKYRDRVFDRFFQLKPSGKGSGIGLTIAKAWVEAHGGKIWAESEGERKGTTVRFTLPVG